MSEKLYPERQRCASCRKKLEETVLDGKYCSYSCAGITPPSANVDLAPRFCKREVSGKWSFKARFRAESEVPQKLQDDPATNIYRCEYCHFLHVGHSRPAEFTREKLRRTVSDTETLGSVIKRAREAKGIDIKILAKRLKVPAVRLKEIEEGNPKMDVGVLMHVIYALRIQMIIQEK
jgi:hypothetical protein